MAMSARLEAAFNEQITWELQASLSYLQMSTYFEAEDLPGFAHWARLQSDEERGHGLRFINFVLDRGNRVAIGAIPAPQASFDTPLAAFSAALDQERDVTKRIRNLYEIADAEHDLESVPILHAFLTEQVEEESTLETILTQLRRAGDSDAALLLLDRELGARGMSPQ